MGIRGIYKMTQTKAEQLADVLSEWWVPPDKEETLKFCISELRRLSPMEMELAGTKAASIARQADLMGKNEALKSRVKELEVALIDLMDETDTPPDRNCSCHLSPPCADCVDWSGLRGALSNARRKIKEGQALAQTVGANHD
jgi:hypothetical protein